MTDEKFVHIHTHSHFSLLDGLTSPKEMAKFAKECGFKSLALTDHGTCGGLYHFQKACKENEIKPIMGMEGYSCINHEINDKDEKFFHIVLLAKNAIGLKNLMKLSTMAEIKGKYKKPRIDYNLLSQYKEGLIMSTACSQGEIPQLILNGSNNLKSITGKYKDLFGDDLYIEIMKHKFLKSTNDSAEREKLEADLAIKLYKHAKEMGIKAIATNDIHYARKSDYKYHDILLAMQTKDIIKNPDRMTFDSDDFYMKTFEEMMAVYPETPDLLSNTVEISEKIDASSLFQSSKDLLPSFVLPEGFKTEEEYLKKMVKDAMVAKGFIDKLEYRERIKFEMNTIVKCGYIKYFLILWDVLNWARTNGIAVGCGRGSAAGSLCLYVLGVTQLDPIKYDLLFERFLNPDRISPPDVDIDFDDTRRDEIISYVTRKYGSDYCCKIGTYMSLKARSIVHYVVKAMDLGGDWEIMQEMRRKNPGVKPEDPKKSLALSDIIAKQVPEGPNVTIEETYKECPEFRRWVDKYDGLLGNLKHMEKVLGSAGVHASGYVVCKNPVTEHIPLRMSNDQVCCQFEGPEVEELGLLKFDFLGLKNITIMDKTLKMIKERHGVDIDIEHLEPNDPKVFAIFNGRHPTIDTRGIFQFESPGMTKLLKEIRVDTFEDLIVANALYRPGPLNAGVHQLYADYKHGRKPIDPLHPKMGEILKNTYSLMVYQESFMKVSRELAGFTRGQSDTLRKCVTGDTMFVSKTRGWITIDRLLIDGYKDDLFLNMDNNGKQEWIKLEDIWSTGNHRVIRVKTKSGLYVDSTQYHQILTNEGWKARMRLSSDDFIVTANEISYDGIDKISSDLAFIIAGLLTEGYFVENKSTFVNYDVEIMNMFCDSFEREFGKKLHITNGTIAYVPLEEREKIAKIMKYGLAGDKYIPEVMMGMTLESTRRFLSFMLTLEGGISKKDHHFEFSSKSKKMIDQVKLLLLRFGITGLVLEKHIKDNPNTYYRLYINDVKDQKNMLQELTCCMQQYKIDDLKHCLSRKQYGTTDIFPPNIVKQLLNQYPYIGKNQSGTLFTSNVSRKRIKDVVQSSKDQNWIDFVNGKQRYDKLKNFTEVISKSITTYDFTVEDGKYPSIIANGIVIHNCVGKKKLEQLAQQRDIFVNGCVKNNINKDIASKIFDQIEYFGGYGFNRSHSACYSMIAYQTAYLKLYYPIEFMANLITTALGNDDKVDLYMSQAKKMGIVIIGPNINKSTMEFKPETGVSIHTKKPYEFLRSPFVSIKGVGEKSVENIVENQPFNSLKDFISKIDMRKVNIGVFKVLLDAGCMDGEWDMKREEILASYEKVKNEFQKEKTKEKNEEKRIKKEQDKITETFGGGSLFDNLSGSNFNL